MKFSAVILAGGRSSRMGRDKALLEVDGCPLLARQIELARKVGAQKVFISGRAEADYAAFGCGVLQDRIPNAGPLTGIEAGLTAATIPLLLVLAVDMPHMNADVLRRLAGHCTATTGAIPRVNGKLDPLSAFYPKRARSLVMQLLDPLVVPASAASPMRTKSPSARTFAERCVAEGLAKFVELPAADAHCFANWNTPSDVSCLT